MLWFKKQPELAAAQVEHDLIEPAALRVALDQSSFLQQFSQIRHQMDSDAGVQAYLDALGAKHALFSSVLAQGKTPGLAEFETLLETVFTARRRLFPALQGLGDEMMKAAVQELLFGKARLSDRLEAFSGLVNVPEAEGREAIKQAGKIRRAMHDFGAELLHFSNPEKYPLMTRWVWDSSTVSGALREFIRGNDHMAEIALDNRPETFEGARRWMAEQLSEQGLYRDVPYWIDLVQAQAYSAYFRSMAEGVLSADFGRSGGPEEHVKKFLGIDPSGREIRSRVKKVETFH